jgi:hypothetical protein
MPVCGKSAAAGQLERPLEATVFTKIMETRRLISIKQQINYSRLANWSSARQRNGLYYKHSLHSRAIISPLNGCMHIRPLRSGNATPDCATWASAAANKIAAVPGEFLRTIDRRVRNE